MENKNILIVEDDSSMRDLLEEAFIHARFNVYISKDIPSDLNNIVMVSEKTTWK